MSSVDALLSARQNRPKGAVTYLWQGPRQAEFRTQSSPEQLVSLHTLSRQPMMPPLLEKLMRTVLSPFQDS